MDMRSLLPDFLKPKAEPGAKSKEEQAPPSTEQILPESTGSEQVVEAETPLISETSVPVVDSVKVHVDSVLTGDDKQKLRYFFLELFRLNGIKGTISIDGDRVKIRISGEMKKNISVEKITLELLQTYKDEMKYEKVNSYDASASFIGSHFILEVPADAYNNTIDFVIRPKKTLKDEHLDFFRGMFEQNIFPKINTESNNVVDQDFINSHLFLTNTDSIIFTDEKLDIEFSTPEVMVPSEEQLIVSLNKILSRGSFGARRFGSVKSEGFGGANRYQYTLLGEDQNRTVRFSLVFEKDSFRIEVSPVNKYFDKNFIIEVLAPIVADIRKISNQGSESAFQKLERMGIKVKENKEKNDISLEALYAREGFMGYEDVKREIEENVIDAWKNKAKYEIATKERFQNIRDIVPNSVLFEGPAGTGKTTLAKIIGAHLDYPFFYIPLKSFMSKWYGESENLLASILETIGKIAEQRGGAVIMIDEIDEIGGNREKSHEASGKITGVLLKKLDGIERINNILLVGATNRKESLDPALLDRFKHSQFFRLPDAEEVSAIVRYYIPELIDIPENVLASITGKISGRSIKKICEDVARRCIKNEEQGIEMSIGDIFSEMCERYLKNQVK